MSTVEKALAVLGLFSETRPLIGVTEAARLLKRDKSTTQRYITDLCNSGFLEKAPGGRGYYLGPAIIRLSMVRDRTNPVAQETTRILSELVKQTGETAHATRFSEDKLWQVSIVETTVKGTRVYVDPAEPLPIHASASGIAFLSASDDAVFTRLLTSELEKYTTETPLNATDLSAVVRAARQDGCAVAAGTFESDVVGQAAAIVGVDGKAIGAVAVASPMSRFNESIRRRNQPHVLRAAALLSELHGAPVSN